MRGARALKRSWEAALDSQATGTGLAEQDGAGPIGEARARARARPRERDRQDALRD